MSRLTEFQEIIGYRFQNEGLLRQALTHSSYAHEKRMKKHSDNERLEFLGDAVLELISSEFLFLNYPDDPEGDLTKMRASVVCEPSLALCTKSFRGISLPWKGRKYDGRQGKEIYFVGRSRGGVRGDLFRRWFC